MSPIKSMCALFFSTFLLTGTLSSTSAADAPYANLTVEHTLVKSQTFSFKVTETVEPGKTIYICFRGKFGENIDGFISINKGSRITWKNEREYYSLNIPVHPGENLITLGVSSKDEVLIHRAWIVGCEGTVKEITDVKVVSVTFRCGRSHAGGFRYIPCEMTLSNAGIRWKFLEPIKREEVIPWADLDDWEAWGRTYGYTLSLTVSKLREGGGSFKFSSSDLDKVVEILRRYVPNKKKSPGGLR